MSGRILANLALLLALLGGLWLVWPAARPMPDVTLNLLDGRTLRSADLRGKSVLLNFWSVNCAVCLRDMPRLKHLHDSLDAQHFMVIGVAIPQDPPSAVISVVERLDPGYPIALDVHGEVSRAFGGIEVTPTSYLITPDGDISFAAHGPLDETRVRATVLTHRG